MSLIHWDKSVLTMHVKEIIEDHHQKGDSTGVLGLGAILLGTIALPAVVKLGRPVLKSIIKTGLSFSPQHLEMPSQKPFMASSHSCSQNNGNTSH